MRKQFALIASVAAILSLASFGAQAMPMSSLKGVSNSDRTITQVSGGCGRHWHRGPRGHCRHN